MISNKLEILTYSPALKPWFEKLNVAWLEKYFVVEDIDRKVLQEPQKYILAHGGHVLFGRYQDQIVATCALKHHGDGVYELTKMAVDESFQGHGFGRVMLERTIECYRKNNGKKLYLESHHSLVPALKLYETGGFQHAERPSGPSVYDRSDIYMVYQESVHEAAR